MPLLSRKVNSSAAVTFGSSSCCITAETSRVFQFAGSFTDEIDQFENFKKYENEIQIMCSFMSVGSCIHFVRIG